MNCLRWVLFLLLTVLTATVHANALTIIYSGNLNGELEPCGCSEEGDLGGIRRRGSEVRSLRQQYPQMLLLSSGGLISHESAQDRIKGKYILTGLATMSYDAIGIQWRDLAFGRSLLSAADLPFVASNWLGEGFDRDRIVERNGLSVAIFSWLDADDDPARAMQAGTAQVHHDVDKLSVQLQQAKANHQVTILLTSMPLAKARARLPLEYADVLLIESNHETFGAAEKLGNTLVLQPGSRGMRLGKVQVQFNDKSQLIAYEHEVISLPKTVADAPELAAWYEEYNREVKAEYLKKAELRKALRAGNSAFAGEESCEQCHSAAYEVWRESEHAKAYEDLEKVGKAFDPECLQCHTVGFDKEGGFIDMKLTSHLINVQCENCHGAAQAHVESGGSKAVANQGWAVQQMCAQCHIGSHSPSFSVEKYWPRIVHAK